MITLDRQIKQKLPELNSMIRREMENRIVRQFNLAKAFIITSFYHHPVTKELWEGSQDPYGASNSSGTLGGYGNLFSFIGFDEGTDPIEPIFKKLEEASFVSSSITSNGILFRFQLPSPEDIWAVTPMPWAEGRSWAHGIESGISGLGWFLATRDAEDSRSGGGVQTKNRIAKRGVKFRNTSYISELLRLFRKKINEISI